MQAVNMADRSQTKPKNSLYLKSKRVAVNSYLHNLRVRDKSATLKLPQHSSDGSNDVTKMRGNSMTLRGIRVGQNDISEINGKK